MRRFPSIDYRHEPGQVKRVKSLSLLTPSYASRALDRIEELYDIKEEMQKAEYQKNVDSKKRYQH